MKVFFLVKCISTMFSVSWPSVSFPYTSKQTANEELLQLSGCKGLYQVGVFMAGDSEKRVHETWNLNLLLTFVYVKTVGFLALHSFRSYAKSAKATEL